MVNLGVVTLEILMINNDMDSGGKKAKERMVNLVILYFPMLTTLTSLQGSGQLLRYNYSI